MSKNSKTFNLNCFLFVSFMVVFGTAFAQLHLRIQTTLTGYRLGQLKSKEAVLLEQRSSLKMELAKISTKEHLSLIASSEHENQNKESLASN